MDKFERNQEKFEKLFNVIAGAGIDELIYVEGKTAITTTQSIALIGTLYNLVTAQQKEIEELKKQCL